MIASMQHKQNSPMASSNIFSRGKHSKDLQDIFTGVFKGTPQRSHPMTHNFISKIYNDLLQTS